MLVACTTASAARSPASWSRVLAWRLSASRAAAARTARRGRPCSVVTGASCSGKTAILAPLAAALAEDCVTFDADLLLDAAGALSRGQPIDWPGFHAALLAVAHGVAQSGRPTVLLAPVGPGTLESLPARRWIGDIRYLVLDCPDDVRRQRMAARPPWRLHDVEEQVSWGRWLRANVPHRVDTTEGTPADSAAIVAAWVLRQLSPGTAGFASFPVD